MCSSESSDPQLSTGVDLASARVRPGYVTVSIYLARGRSPEWVRRCIAELRTVPGIELDVTRNGVHDHHGVDAILDVSGRSALPHLISAPRFGYWTFLYGARPARRDLGLREHLKGERAVSARLVRLTGRNRGVVLKEGVFKTVPHSLRSTSRRVTNAAALWPAQYLKQLLANGIIGSGPRVPFKELSTLSRMLMHLLRPAASVRNVVKRIAQELSREYWKIGVIAKPVQHVLDSFDPAAIRWLPGPDNGFLADPFGAMAPDGSLTILAEALSWKNARGRIVAFELNQRGDTTPPRDVLTFRAHASYPQIIHHAGRIYCMPELSQLGHVQLFRAEEFPDRWVPDRILLEDFAGADATVLQHQGRWWMFAGNHKDQDEAKLFIFHADELFGPWRAHHANPVKIDLRSARPAGPPFFAGSKLYRPAQDCSRTYGGAIVINQITKLSALEFSEVEIVRLQPQKGSVCPDGLHTLCGAGSFTLIDGKRQGFSLASVASGLRRLTSTI
jgi:hypothetical protein